MRSGVIVMLTAALVAGGCSADKKTRQSAPEPASHENSDGGRRGALPLGNLDSLGSLLSKQLNEPGPYDEPRASAGFDEEGEHYAVMELSGPIVELAGFSLWSAAPGRELGAVMKKLNELAADQAVKGLLLRAGELSMSPATAEELRAALVRFKGNGTRRLVCHTEAASNATYYLLSACDSLGLAPSGQIVISGVAAMPIHVKGLLDKLGVRADFLHIGAYKGAAEPFTRDKPSDEMRETLTAIMDGAYKTLVRGIAEGRKLDPDVVDTLIDTALFQGKDAISAGLVDEVAVFERYRDGVLDGAEWQVVQMDAGQPDLGQLMRFVGVMPRMRPWQPHVALVYAVGQVIDGKGGGVLGARQEIASRPLAAALRVLAQDDKVKAIVLRIDSPGGSALASEILWNAVAEAREKKPVIVSMAGVAASGGYYIGCGATKIYALENTLTGSIGVVGGKLALGGALAKIGVTAHPMGRGKRALMDSPVDVWTADERAAIEGMMQGIYQTFVSRVATGRGMAEDRVQEVARGRVWTGADAKEKGLVDAIGGLHEALAEARKLGGVDADVALEVYPPEPTLMDILASFGQVQAPWAVDSTMVQAMHDLSRAVGPAEAGVVASLVSQLLLFQHTPVLAATFWPVALH